MRRKRLDAVVLVPFVHEGNPVMAGQVLHLEPVPALVLQRRRLVRVVKRHGRRVAPVEAPAPAVVVVAVAEPQPTQPEAPVPPPESPATDEPARLLAGSSVPAESADTPQLEAPVVEPTVPPAQDDSPAAETGDPDAPAPPRSRRRRHERRDLEAE